MIWSIQRRLQGFKVLHRKTSANTDILPNPNKPHRHLNYCLCIIIHIQIHLYLDLSILSKFQAWPFYCIIYFILLANKTQRTAQEDWARTKSLFSNVSQMCSRLHQIKDDQNLFYDEMQNNRLNFTKLRGLTSTIFVKKGKCKFYNVSNFTEAYLHQRGKFCCQIYQILQWGYHTLCLFQEPNCLLDEF